MFLTINYKISTLEGQRSKFHHYGIFLQGRKLFINKCSARGFIKKSLSKITKMLARQEVLILLEHRPHLSVFK